eukprot:767760-Hanusia_phi.AAC.3
MAMVVNQGEEKAVLQEHNLNVSDVAWTSDDLFLVSGDQPRRSHVDSHVQCNKLFSGDSRGCIKAWDLRMMSDPACDTIAFHIESNKPISDLHFATPSLSQECPMQVSLFAANSYDNILRISPPCFLPDTRPNVVLAASHSTQVFTRANVENHEGDQATRGRESVRIVHSLQVRKEAGRRKGD